jgi:phosphoribosylamine---glycine ligase
MKVLVVGSGGREHALVWKLAQSPKVTALFCAPGNGGIEEMASCVHISPGDLDSLVDFVEKEAIELVIVGPENPLADGIVEKFERIGIPIFGPGRRGAQIEASKIFSKELMAKYGIPTAAFKSFSDYRSALLHLQQVEPPFVIKADGLCAGKGAYVIQNREAAGQVLHTLMVQGIYGEAGKKVVIESFLPGIEASYIAFTDGISVVPLLASQDHKPLLDDDRGPNTGGMGAYAPIPFIDGSMEDGINRTIMQATIDALRQEGIVYKGALYGGLMLQGRDATVVEFNCRFGDPETQPLLFQMESDILPYIVASCEGRLRETEPIRWKPGVSICVVLASGGYPEKPETGKIIHGLEALRNNKYVMVFHAGTKKEGNRLVSTGGRVLGVTAFGETYKDAIHNVYDAVHCIEFEGMQFRSDIGRKAVKPRICTGSGI